MVHISYYFEDIIYALNCTNMMRKTSVSVSVCVCVCVGGGPFLPMTDGKDYLLESSCESYK